MHLGQTPVCLEAFRSCCQRRKEIGELGFDDELAGTIVLTKIFTGLRRRLPEYVPRLNYPVFGWSHQPVSPRLNTNGFTVGGVSAAVSKTAAAPIERIKLLIQNQVGHPFSINFPTGMGQGRENFRRLATVNSD